MNPKEILKKENFIHIYDWSDNPGTIYEKHSHKDRVTLFIIQGDVTFSFNDGSTKNIKHGDRFDVPPGLEHSASVGKNGCVYVVGEMIEGDS